MISRFRTSIINDTRLGICTFDKDYEPHFLLRSTPTIPQIRPVVGLPETPNRVKQGM